MSNSKTNKFTLVDSEDATIEAQLNDDGSYLLILEVIAGYSHDWASGVEAVSAEQMKKFMAWVGGNEQ